MGEQPQDNGVVDLAKFLERFGLVVFRAMLIICLLPSLLSLIIGVGYFAHDTPGLVRVLLWLLPLIAACGFLLLPRPILMARRATRLLTLAAAVIVAHQIYGSFNTFKVLAERNGPIVFFCIACAFVAGAVSLALYLRRNSRWKPVPFAAGALLVLIALVFGSGNPQWSRFIFVWQVYYSPFRVDAANLPTNRGEPRSTLPRYTEWDSRGRKTLEWSHPNGTLLRTEFYPQGQKRSEVLHVGRDVVTKWFPNGQMAYQCDFNTGIKRWWNEDGTLRREAAVPNPVK
jgi:hypothetical protein